MKLFREACCTSVEAAVTAMNNGADRVELCRNLEVGGVTPSRAMIQEVMRQCPGLTVNVLVRPRGGNFVFTDEEVASMLDDIAMCKELGVNAVVIGALRADGGIDIDVMRRLISASRPLKVTFHRAFDECSDPMSCLEDIISLGCERLLTSGHEKDAYQGRFTIRELVKQAAGRIVIMAGCGVRPSNIMELHEVTSAPEYHSSTLTGW